MCPAGDGAEQERERRDWESATHGVSETPTAVGVTEPVRQEEHPEQAPEHVRDPRDDAGPRGDHREELADAHRARQRRFDHRTRPADHRRSGRAERRVRGVEEEAEHRGGQRREPETDEKRRGERTGCAESRRALDDSHEAETDEQHLNAPVLFDLSEVPPDCGDGAAPFEVVHQEDGAEDDEDDIDGL